MKIKIDSKKKFSLPSTIILTGFMVYNAYFFVVARTTGLERVASWIMFLFFIWVFFMMHYTGIISKYRRILFVASAILFAPAFISLLYEERGNMFLTTTEFIKSETPFCHIVIPMTIIPNLLFKSVIFPGRLTKHFASVYSMLVIWLAATLVIGRGWCSWACFYGGWEDGFSRLRKKPVFKLDPNNDKVRYFGFVILAFVVLASLTTLTAVYCEWLCPFKIISEYFQVINMSSYISIIIFVVAFFALAVAAPILTRRRFQCMTFCPFGAFQSLLDFFSLYRLRINPEKCGECMRCVTECPTMSLTEDVIKNKKGKPLITCTKCGECIDVCPKGALSYGFRFCRTPREKLWMKWREKVSRKEGLVYKILARGILVLDEIISPRALFTFCGFTFGMILTTGFGVGSIQRIINLIVNGSFLL